MEEPMSAFPFRKLRYDKYLTLEVMMFVAHKDSCEFMFSVNKETRAFLKNNMGTIQNGFMNEGLIDYSF
jgi:hypothetical protein